MEIRGCPPEEIFEIMVRRARPGDPIFSAPAKAPAPAAASRGRAKARAPKNVGKRLPKSRLH
jgi:hypothetical protein